MQRLGRDLPLRLLIVGEGAIRPSLQARADEVNAALRRRAVILTGQRLDPRPAYAAADIVIGMGSSALRGLAFAKPVVVVGEDAFSATFTPETADIFYYYGMYGYGDVNHGNVGLIESIRALADRPEGLPALGDFSRKFVIQHFSLEAVGALLARYYCTAAAAAVRPLPIAVADACRSSAVSVRKKQMEGLPMGPILRRMLGRFSEDYRYSAGGQSSSWLRSGRGSRK